MGQNTKIAWCHDTQNFWTGCAKVSAECKNCYAVTAPPTRISRSRGLELWGEKAHRQVASDKMWAAPIRLNRLAEKSGERRRVFCNSLSDFFEDYQGPDSEAVRAARQRAFAVMQETPWLDWLVLTKRIENVMAMVPPDWVHDEDCGANRPLPEMCGLCTCLRRGASWPKNVWIGTTVGTQEMAEERLPHLLEVPAAVRFVSCEPQLEKVWLSPWFPHCSSCGVPEGPSFAHLHGCLSTGPRRGIDWVIIGGESGPGARPFDLAWARSIIAQCADRSIPVFMKQLGACPYDSDLARRILGCRPGDQARAVAAAPVAQKDAKGGDPAEWPEDLRVRQIPVPGRAS